MERAGLWDNEGDSDADKGGEDDDVDDSGGATAAAPAGEVNEDGDPVCKTDGWVEGCASVAAAVAAAAAP